MSVMDKESFDEYCNFIFTVLKKHEEPGIYCLLGELEDNIEHFNKALELSNNKYIRACEKYIYAWYDFTDMKEYF